MEVEASSGTEPVPASRWSRVPLPATGRLELLAFDLRFAGLLGHTVGILCRRRRSGVPHALSGEDVPDEFSCTEGAQAEVLGPSALVVVPATSVQVHPGEEAPEALSQVLLVDSTLALRSHARRITNPEEYDGYLFSRRDRRTCHARCRWPRGRRRSLVSRCDNIHDADRVPFIR